MYLLLYIYIYVYTPTMLKKKICFENYPIASMYGIVAIFPCIYHKNQPNVGKYTSPMDAMGTNLPRRIVQEFFVEIEWPWHLRGGAIYQCFTPTPPKN